jgi:hypothetical protein
MADIFINTFFKKERCIHEVAQSEAHKRGMLTYLIGQDHMKE